MPEVKSPRDILGEVMAGAQKTQTPLLAELLKSDRVTEVDSSEERQRFWQSALTDEQEQQMWADAMAARGLTQLVPGSREVLDIGMAVSKAKYPTRFDMMEQEGRTTEAQQAMWAAEHARKGMPEPKPEAP